MRALAYMLSVPASATETMKADLAGIVVEIMQEPEFESDPAVSIAAMTAAYRLSFLPAGRQQLLEKLTPASSAAMIEMSLKVLEDDNSETGGMLVAGLLTLFKAAQKGLPDARISLDQPACQHCKHGIIKLTCQRKDFFSTFLQSQHLACDSCQ